MRSPHSILAAAGLVALLTVSVITVSAFAGERPAVGGAPPTWFFEEISTLTASSGRWIADNSRYRSEQEPFDAYGTEWRTSFGGTSMQGRLFGLREGEEVGTFWEFRQYWHPGRGEAVVEQFGPGGVVGVGRMWREGEVTVSEQTFYRPGTEARRAGHRSRFPAADTHVTESFDLEGEVWKPRRTYTWVLEGERGREGERPEGGTR